MYCSPRNKHTGVMLPTVDMLQCYLGNLVLAFEPQCMEIIPSFTTSCSICANVLPFGFVDTNVFTL